MVDESGKFLGTRIPFSHDLSFAFFRILGKFLNLLLVPAVFCIFDFRVLLPESERFTLNFVLKCLKFSFKLG